MQFNASNAKHIERCFTAFLNKHHLEYRMHRSRTSAYFKIVFDGNDFLIRISDHASTQHHDDTPDFEVLSLKQFNKLKRIFKRVIKLSYKPEYKAA